MNTVKAVKQQDVQKHNFNNNNIEHSTKSAVLKWNSSCELYKSSLTNNRLRKIKSEADLATILQDKDLKVIKSVKPSKSERNLNSVYNYMTSTPCDTSRNSNVMEISTYSMIADSNSIKIPIVGYEVMEERSRFTIFKLRIENYEKNSFWLVLRRFTDFTRLHTKLKQLFPSTNLVLPKKKWFGNNFSSGFLDTRIAGLQTFINTILGNPEMKKCPVVREFFCLDEPPLFSESMEDCKAIFEAQEETIAYLKMQLKAKDEIITNLNHKNDYLTSLVKSSIGKCSKTDNSY
ncbi:unnamed protein product [Chironomus riparius]|uniref:PX domain-containing protein n=1 Tax=Chironomus riparius TaxID=315576 RepID=A0A9N9RMX4_9DIPT|nr:unnamed protein product [Chironomus riparius]